jgi:hypothetical protein
MVREKKGKREACEMIQACILDTPYTPVGFFLHAILKSTLDIMTGDNGNIVIIFTCFVRMKERF